MSDAWKALLRKPETERPTAPVISLNGDADGARRYALKALQLECDLVATVAEGERNDALNRAAFRIGRLVGPGRLGYSEAADALAGAGRACGLPQNEIDTILRDNDNAGLRRGQEHLRPIPERDSLPQPTVLDLDPAEDDDFWTSRALLEHLHAYARARRVAPWAVLGVVLARVVTAVPHFVVLPPIVGGVGSLNLFVGLVGRSGAGKGAAESVAREAFDIGQIETHTTGSGEGIAHGYMRRERGETVQHCHAALFSVPEIDTLTALGGRMGATLMPELRRGWSGEALGFAYADPTKRLPVPAHQYRMCLVAGIQPGRAGTLLDDTDGGTPQRFLWLPATDGEAPDDRPTCPDPMVWRSPDTRPTSGFSGPGGRIHMTVCDTARDTIDQARLDRIRGAGEALDGHGLFTRLKVAAALACAEGRLDVRDDDWELSGVVHRKSDATREGVAALLRSQVKEANTARAEAEAGRAVLVADRVADAAVKRVCNVIVRALAKKKDGEWTTHRGIESSVAGRDRKRYFEAALDRLVDAGQVEFEELLDGTRYRLTGGR